MIFRHGHQSDLPEVYEICHGTGYLGQDASEVVSDRRLLGHYFAAPYLVHAPRWCWVACDENGVAGYLVTAPDSREFADWMNREWLPAVRQKVAQEPGSPVSEFETWLRNLIHQPMPVPDFADDYPGHLHIDFLPRAQGQGLGPRAFALFADQAKRAGLKGFHLGVGAENLRARRFYSQAGLEVLREDTGVIYLGKRL